MSSAQTKQGRMEKICVKIMTHHLLTQAGVGKSPPLRETVRSITDVLQNVLGSLSALITIWVGLIYCESAKQTDK